MTEKAIVEMLAQRWVHSHEEDTSNEIVFRPASFSFPRSRGRRSYELGVDGRLVEFAIGPADSPEQYSGTWKLEGEDTLVLQRESESQPGRILSIVSVEPARLVVKRQY